MPATDRPAATAASRARARRLTLIRSALITGGVACNRRLRSGFRERAAKEGLSVYFPSPGYTTDNAAMIASAGFLHLDRGRHASMNLGADANLKL